LIAVRSTGVGCGDDMGEVDIGFPRNRDNTRADRSGARLD
jgi:hypothetical protein